MKDKMSFVEFLAFQETDIEKGESIKDNIEWATEVINSFPIILLNERHQGDCTNESNPCPLCSIETLLREYREYLFPDLKHNSDEGRRES